MVTENLELRKAIHATIPDDHHSIKCREWTVEAMRAIAAIYLEHSNGNRKDAQTGFYLLCTIGQMMIAMGNITIEKKLKETENVKVPNSDSWDNGND